MESQEDVCVLDTENLERREMCEWDRNDECLSNDSFINYARSFLILLQEFLWFEQFLYQNLIVLYLQEIIMFQEEIVT